jgi:ABC-type Fe3+/spermidine/putrescine transport system ATPase subunit
MEVIALEGVEFGWTGHAVLRRLDLAVRDGGVTVLLGPSGSGKSTVLRLIAGFETPARGRVLIAGELVSEGGRIVRPPERRGLSMVFQDLALWPHMSVSDTLEFVLGRCVRGSEGRQRIAETLATVGLDHRRDARPAQLSGGERQRLALARALVTRPRILLMDEPLASLDPPLRLTLLEEIRQLQNRLDLTIVYVTHSPQEAFALGDHAAVIHRGHIEQTGTPRELYECPRTAFVASLLGRCAVLPLKEGHRLETLLGAPLPWLGADVSRDGLVAVVRPEDVVADEHGPYSGTVASTSFTAGAFETELVGPGWRLWGRLGEEFARGIPVRFSIRKVALVAAQLPVGEHGGAMGPR